MTVYRPPERKIFRYDFVYKGTRYSGSTAQVDIERARLVEAKIKLALRESRGQIAEPGPAPSWSEWADIYYAWCERMHARTGRPKRLDRIDELLRVVLRFWGQQPLTQSMLSPAAGEEAPFHGLTLTDPIDDPSWILAFEAWMDRRGSAGSTRNHYTTVCSRLYYCAMLPEYRKLTRIAMNPFIGRPRAPKVTATVALTPEQVLKWIGAMSYHARLAVAIAALAPKLRLRNILTLDWHQHLDREITRITVTEHKSDVITGKPLVVPVSAQLRTILRDARARTPECTRVVTYRGQPIDSIRSGLRAAAKDAGIPYGRGHGATFHTLRHTASTILAGLQVNPWLHRDVMGHADLATTDGYTHLQLEEQRPVFEALSAELPIASVVTAPQRRASRIPPAPIQIPPIGIGGRVGKAVGHLLRTHEKTEGKTPFLRAGGTLAGRPFSRKSL